MLRINPSKVFTKINKTSNFIRKKHISPFRIKCSNVSYRCCYSEKNVWKWNKTVKFSNKDSDDMTEIVKALEDSDVLMKGVSKTLKSDIKKGGALPKIPMLLGTLRASLLTGRGLFWAGKGIYRAGKEF